MRADVAIVGAGIAGSSIAWWLTRLDPTLSVVLLERDTGFGSSSSQLSASSIRQQFSTPINIQMSQFGLEFLSGARSLLAVEGEEVEIGLTLPGYLFLALPAQAEAMRAQNAIQHAHGARIELLGPEALAARFAWLNTADLALGALGAGVEGWFDGPALHSAILRSARAQGARLVRAEVSAFEFAPTAPGASPDSRRVAALHLADGRRVVCGQAVNAAGPWSRRLAAAAGIELPVHARRRTVFVLSCPTPVPGCPLVVDPAGFWFRPEGRHFIFGTTPNPDTDDLPLEPNLAEFDETAWAALAHRVPAFESVRVERAWAGYYEMNLFDHNALLGLHPGFANLWCATGFSGHGVQQAPAAGRGLAELLLYGGFRTLDLSPLSVGRLAEGRRVLESNVIG
ncbi:FAD-dependent oxidoreductase [Archangium violaceum Cb vi76]|uniref:FAD-dependent oxidoreductase n=1 Tax=Archangium violaceum Cb vi76 TaxID=1406225 RepID=A0A084SZA2_9BACT|nr:FAD-dependent oxidoreductase [Archangium violaceum Cb vi76]